MPEVYVQKGHRGILQFYSNIGRESTASHTCGVFSQGFRGSRFLLSQTPCHVLPSSIPHWLRHWEGTAFINHLPSILPWTWHFIPEFRSSGLCRPLFLEPSCLGPATNLLPKVSRDIKSRCKDLNTGTFTHQFVCKDMSFTLSSNCIDLQ